MPHADVTEIRYIYNNVSGGNKRHRVECMVPAGLPDEETIAALNAMRENQVLEGYHEGSDYSWMGISEIAFRKHEMAALFIFFLT